MEVEDDLPNEMTQKILSMIKAHPHISIKEIADQTGLSNEQVKSALKKISNSSRKASEKQNIDLTKIKEKSQTIFPPVVIHLAYAQWLRESPDAIPFKKWFQLTYEKWYESQGKSFETWLREMAHSKPIMTMTSEKPETVTSHYAVKEICDALKSKGFSVEVCENYVFAKRNCLIGLPVGLFIAIEEERSAQLNKYTDANISVICPLTEFRQRLSSLLSWWSRPKRANADGLNINVLTSFGWHSWLNEEERKECLIAAAGELGEEHVHNVLLWLCNSWSSNPMIPQAYSANVRCDYQWSILIYREKRFLLSFEK